MVEKSNGSGTKKMAVSQRERKEAVKLYQSTDLTADEIGSRYGVSRQTVHRWIQDAGVPLRGPMGPRARGPEEATPAGGLMGRLMDELDTLRRELAELRGSFETNWTNNQAQLEALTAALNQLVGAYNAHTQTASDYMNWMRECMGRLDKRLPD